MKHVWIGEKAYITKSGGVNDNTIIGACSVLSKKFVETNIVVAGNPAVIVRRNVEWIRNSTMLTPNSLYFESFNKD